jgi:hypothetical protein
MPPRRHILRQQSRSLRAAFPVSFVVFLGTAAAILFLRRSACAEEVLKITETHGIRFVIERSSCDIVAKDESISVYATKTPESQFGRMVKRLRKPAPLFRYDPGAEDTPLPSITMSGPDQIRIKIASVSSIASQDRAWEGKSVYYDIGKIYYPASAK